MTVQNKGRKTKKIEIPLYTFECLISGVADPGCLPPDPNCLHPGSRILKEFKYFNPQKSKKMVSKLKI
jgi:hypothetical protein